MWKMGLAGVLALATVGVSLAANPARAQDARFVQRQLGPTISTAQIGRFKAALRLTREQERHWPAVAAALRHVRLGNRATAIAANALGLRELVSAARPLFQSLDDNQKMVALHLVESLGFGAFVAAL